MKFIRETPRGFVITAHGPGFVRIGEKKYRSSLAVCGEDLLTEWPVSDGSLLTPADFDPVLSWHPDLVLLGTGNRLRFPPRAVLAHFRDLGIGLEVMDTPAACRTYNMIRAEERRVAAAMIID